MELESLVVPAANAAEDAGNLIKDIGNLWVGATMEEQRKLLLTMLDAVYIDARKTKSIVAIRPKPPFKPIFQVAATKQDSVIRILNEPLKGTSVFLVETGEDSALSSLRVDFLVKERRAYGIRFLKLIKEAYEIVKGSMGYAMIRSLLLFANAYQVENRLSGYVEYNRALASIQAEYKKDPVSTYYTVDRLGDEQQVKFSL